MTFNENNKQVVKSTNSIEQISQILFKIVVGSFMLLPIFGYCQTKFDTELLIDYKKNGYEIASKLKTIETPQYTDSLKNCIYLKNGFRSFKFLNEKDWLAIKDSVEPYRIDIVYSKYPLRKGVYNEIYSLLFNRIKSLFEMDHNLNDSEFEWNKVLQTNCINDKQVNKLFHGVVIWYRNEEKEQNKLPIEVLTKSEIIEKEESKLVSEQTSIEELTQSIENIKSSSFIPDSLKKLLDKKSLDEQIKSIKSFLEKEITKEPEIILAKASDSELKKYNNEVENFIKNYPARDSIVKVVLNRHPEWKNILVINDWTGSMYGYGAQILQWHLLNFEKSGIISLTLFNDGDQKADDLKKVGKTGGIYTERADNVLKLVKLFNYIMLKGSGGDGPENDIEGILEAMETYPFYSEIVLIADNNACVRDIELADRIGKPIKIIICGYNKNRGINPDFVYLAKKTGGSIYTIEDDLENINVELGTRGEIVSLLDTRFKVTSKKCNNLSMFSEDEISDFKYAKHHKRRIRKLNLENKGLSEIPSSIYKMEKINYLNLSHNFIEEISPKIDQLEYLKTLNLSNNKINTLPNELKRVHFIETLILSNNNFKSFPIPILGMKFLLSLDLSFNQITKLDKNISLRKLEHLNLSNNLIEDISKSLSQLRNLKTLDLSNNLISTLPDNFTNLTKLVNLNLANNNLNQLPLQFYKLKNLSILNLEGNSFSEEEKTRIKNSLIDTKIFF